jgi:hypothetical protein
LGGVAPIETDDQECRKPECLPVKKSTAKNISTAAAQKPGFVSTQTRLGIITPTPDALPPEIWLNPLINHIPAQRTMTTAIPRKTLLALNKTASSRETE